MKSSPLLTKEDLTVCQSQLPLLPTRDIKRSRIWSRYKRRPQLRLLSLALFCVCVIAWAHFYRLVTRDTDHSPEEADGGETLAAAELPVDLRQSGDQDGKVVQHFLARETMGQGERHRRSEEKKMTTQRPVNETCHKKGQEFPSNFFNREDTRNGGWILNIIVAVYVFGCIAQACDNYFVPSLEHFCEDFGLSPDVAGATFMAAGSSAPELATSLIGLFVAKSDVGVGAIVGSSIFNILVIVGAVGLFAGMVSWYPVTRDVIVYILSVGTMVGSMADNSIVWPMKLIGPALNSGFPGINYLIAKVPVCRRFTRQQSCCSSYTWTERGKQWEAFTMICLYSCYIMLMVFNTNIRQCIGKSDVNRKMSFAGSSVMRKNSTILAINMEARGRSRIANKDPTMLKSVDITLKHEYFDKDSRDFTYDALRKASSSRVSPEPSKVQVPISKPANPRPIMEEERHVVFESSTDGHIVVTPPTEEGETVLDLVTSEISEIAVDEYENPLIMPDGCLAKLYFFMYLPTTVLHAFTIPDSRIAGGWQAKMYPVSFALSVTYIAIYSYIMVWMALYAGSGVGLPDSVVGLTVLAAGTSVPDLMSSIYIARDGYGDMAVSNAIGSNIFDILIGLGLPWMINSLINHEAATNMANGGLYYLGTTLFATAVFVWILLLACHWTLNKVVGFIAIGAYVGIIAFCILVEMNVFFVLKTTCVT